MYTLYARKGAGSLAVEAMLARCGAPHRIEDLERNADGSFPEALRRLNPRSEVPTLVLPDDSVMTESAAIMIHLGDIYPEAKLAPPLTSPQRPRYLRWMVYLAATVYMSDLRYYYPAKYTTDPSAADGIKAKAGEGMANELAIYADALGQGPFLLGPEMSAADIYAAMLVSWVPDMGVLFAAHSNLKAMYEKVIAHPVIAAVWTRNEM